MNLYLFINFGVVFFPLLLSFDRRVVFYRQWPAVIPAILVIAALFIGEDIVAVTRGHWDFAPEYAGKYRLLGLPPGEWLFFLSVPFACVFVYACVRSYQKERRVPFPRSLSLLFVLAALILGFVFRHQGYTRSVMGLTALAWAALALLRPDLPRSGHFWSTMGITYLAFTLVNSILTGIPVVTYGEEAIWGVRIGTIPLEDFFYSFSLLSLNFLLFRLVLDRGRRPSPAPGLKTAPSGVDETASPPAAYGFLEKR